MFRIAFARLQLKGKPFQIQGPVTDDEVDLLKRHLRELFPDLDLTKLQKAHTKSGASYQKWMGEHTRQRQYYFQVSKCGNLECCSETVTRAELLDWLPDPVLDESREHLKPNSDVKGQGTDDHDRPSYKTPEKGKANINMKAASQILINTNADETTGLLSHVNASVFTAQNASYSVERVECKKSGGSFTVKINLLTGRKCNLLLYSLNMRIPEVLMIHYLTVVCTKSYMLDWA